MSRFFTCPFCSKGKGIKRITSKVWRWKCPSCKQQVFVEWQDGTEHVLLYEIERVYKCRYDCETTRLVAAI